MQRRVIRFVLLAFITLLLSFPSCSSLAPYYVKLYTQKSKSDSDVIMNRRSWLQKSVAAAVTSALVTTSSTMTIQPAYADEADDFFSDPAVQENYNNPNIPQAQEEKSGLVVLRVAEVAQFQEKILRSIVSGELEGVKVAPMQFTFGTQILLRNSNLDGNIKLMLDTEIPRRSRKAAVQNAVAAMNQLQEILQYSNSIQRDFEPIEMATLADMYRNVRVNLNQLYEYLPDREKEKYYGYFVAVTEYEKKIADGTYNPDLDGILKFDD